jgi:sec-independent protein translocase protein TatA
MIGTTELVCICGIAALLFGATKLPEFARALGSSVGEFKKARLETEKELKEMQE